MPPIDWIQTDMAKTTLPTPAAAVRMETMVERLRRHARLVLPLRLAVLVFLAGAGFLIGAVMGVLCGIALGRNQLLSDVFSIYIKVANSIPRVVLGSIFIVALGLGAASKIALAVVMVFFVVFANAFQGVREADKNLIANARILGASDWQMTRAVVIPSALSWILASLHVSFGVALVGAIVGEFL